MAQRRVTEKEPKNKGEVSIKLTLQFSSLAL